MKILFTYFFKLLRYLSRIPMQSCDWLITWFLLYTNNVKFGAFKSNGIPYINVAIGAKCNIQRGIWMNNSVKSNPIGRSQRCIIRVSKGAVLEIGQNVGMSSTAIVANKQIMIGNNVKIGGNVCIYDTDFHSLNFEKRKTIDKDRTDINAYPVIIDDYVFIGAHSTILKGVHIGEKAIIGACSVITKNIPAKEIWAGNPAKKIGSVE